MTLATKTSCCTIDCYQNLQVRFCRVRQQLPSICESNEWTLNQTCQQHMALQSCCTTWITRWFKPLTERVQSYQLWQGGNVPSGPVVYTNSQRFTSSNQQEERFRLKSREPKLGAFSQIGEQHLYDRTLPRNSCLIWTQPNVNRLSWRLIDSFVKVFHHRVIFQSRSVLIARRTIH